ncbi:MAG: ATP-dependent RecD-like DNA helicase [Desulfobacterales bacterium]|nr:MAG: ATP-dependent RecD-like DNA helicase [Desulfobacterales bacterium]
MLTDLSGQIERITYTNEENGFTIAKVKVRGQRDLVTVVGNLIAPTPGEVLEMRGEWAKHPKFGEQFKVVQVKTKVPVTVYGIKKYLGSGLVKGLGPVMAGRIVDKFGQKTLDIIENKIERLAQVEGIGTKRIAMIARAWEDQKEIRDVMLFLQSHGVGSGFATKIFKAYGNRSIAVVKKNPYRLATDIFGIGFLSADKIAENLGFAKDSQLRVEAGILYVLHQLADDGHVYFPYEPLIDKCRQMLEVDREAVVNALGSLSIDQKVIIEDLNERIEEYKENHKAVYLTMFHRCESSIANRLKKILHTATSIRAIDSAKAVQWVQQQLSIILAENQLKAIQWTFENKMLVITGGPGTGKTTIINAILKILSKIDARVILAAPTGRAAKRMSEASGHEAKTIHRMLEYSLQKGGFQRNEDKPLKCDVLIIDEASMIDTILMYYLLRALPPAAMFILVGDVNQLPSVGAGNVLNDIIASESVPVVTLNEIFRQAQTSRIITNAHKINNGDLPDIKRYDSFDPANDFYFIEQEDPERVLDIILELTQKRIPQRFGYKPIEDIQILTPMHKGVVGAGNLNNQLQAALNPGEGGIGREDRSYRVNDKVMQIRNNYDKEVFNGDIGRIAKIRYEDHEVMIAFDDREVSYDYSELDEIVLAYAISVHKSQGSEYPVVVMPILTQHYVLLQRNLIYTAATRGRNLVVMVGSRKALAIGVHNDKTQKRYTRLRQRLRCIE